MYRFICSPRGYLMYQTNIFTPIPSNGNHYWHQTLHKSVTYQETGNLKRWFTNHRGRPKSHEILMVVSKKMPNNAMMSQSLIVLTILTATSTTYNWALWHHSILWLFETDKFLWFLGSQLVRWRNKQNRAHLASALRRVNKCESKLSNETIYS